MKQRIQSVLTAALVMTALVFSAVVPLRTATVGALNPADSAQGGVDAAGGGSTGPNSIDKMIKTVINILLFILGAVAVIMIVIGGIRYSISGGDASQIKGAKDTVLYAVIGLVVALLAYAIVNFVINQF